MISHQKELKSGVRKEPSGGGKFPPSLRFVGEGGAPRHTIHWCARHLHPVTFLWNFAARFRRGAPFAALKTA